MPKVPQLQQPAIAISGSQQQFPVRRIYCVGRNYAEHVREMGNDPQRDLPFCFSKPADAVVGSGRRLPFPPRTAQLHHEVELVVALHGRGANLAEADAGAIVGHAVGIDLTRRDLQAEAKKRAVRGTWPRDLILPRRLVP